MTATKEEAPPESGAEQRMTCANYAARTEQARQNFIAELEKAARELHEIVAELRQIQRGGCL